MQGLTGDQNIWDLWICLPILCIVHCDFSCGDNLFFSSDAIQHPHGKSVLTHAFHSILSTQVWLCLNIIFFAIKQTRKTAHWIQTKLNRNKSNCQEEIFSEKLSNNQQNIKISAFCKKHISDINISESKTQVTDKRFIRVHYHLRGLKSNLRK